MLWRPRRHRRRRSRRYTAATEAAGRPSTWIMYAAGGPSPASATVAPVTKVTTAKTTAMPISLCLPGMDPDYSPIPFTDRY